MSITKKNAAEQAVTYLKNNMILGVGTGSTVAYFIDALAKTNLDLVCVPTSKDSAHKLKNHHITVESLNHVGVCDLYIDGADEIDSNFQMIKGGGGAHVLEKIVATASKKFLCIVDESKVVKRLGKFPVAVEVILEARSYVARALSVMGGSVHLRENFTSDNGNPILDVYFDIQNALELENNINQITGVVDNGIFSKKRADCVIIGNKNSYHTQGAL